MFSRPFGASPQRAKIYLSEMDKRIKTSIVLFIGLIVFPFLFNLLKSAYSAISGLIFVIFFIISLFYLLILIFKKWDKNNLYAFTVLIFGLTLTWFRVPYKIIEATKAPVIFHGICEHTVSFVWVKLRSDNTFDFEPGSFLDRNIIRGNYRISNDTVFLETFDGKIPNLQTSKPMLKITNRVLVEIKDTTVHSHFHWFFGNTKTLNEYILSNSQ